MQDLFRYPGIPQDQFSMVLLPLFSNEFVYGLVLCDLTENLFSNAEFLLNQMSSAAKNSHVLFRVPTKQCPGICTGRCTPHSTFLIERAKKHIILPFPPAFICFRKTWIPHFRRCSRMRMQCFTSRNRNEIRMLQKFYQNRN